MPPQKSSDFSPTNSPRGASRARRDRVVVELWLDASLPSIRADRAMLYEALNNILDNSLRGMSGAETLSLHSTASRARVEVTVSDASEG
jgi:nitrogen-specific signal transduction histidine kinase